MPPSEQSEPPELRPTSKGRAMRMLKLIEYIKERKSLELDEALRYAMRNWLISSRVARTYIRDLEIAGLITVETKGLKEYIVYREG